MGEFLPCMQLSQITSAVSVPITQDTAWGSDPEPPVPGGPCAVLGLSRLIAVSPLGAGSLPLQPLVPSAPTQLSWLEL